LWAAPAFYAQDAATEERLNRLSGQIEDLKSGQDSLHKQVQALLKEMDGLREQMGKPSGKLRRPGGSQAVAEAVKEVDQKRIEDAEKIRIELLNLRKACSHTAAHSKEISRRCHDTPPAINLKRIRIYGAKGRHPFHHCSSVSRQKHQGQQGPDPQSQPPI